MTEKTESPVSEEERQEIHQELKEKYEYVFDLDNIKPQEHNWIARGIKATCENAAHPSHAIWFKKEVTQADLDKAK